MRMLRCYAPQIRSDFSAGSNEASHSGCAALLSRERKEASFLRRFVVVLIAVNPLFHAGLCISQWPIFNLRVVLSVFDRSCHNLNLSVPNSVFGTNKGLPN